MRFVAALTVTAVAALASSAAPAATPATCGKLEPAPPAVSDATAVQPLRELTTNYIAAHQQRGSLVVRDGFGMAEGRDNLLAALSFAEGGRFDAAESLASQVMASQDLDLHSRTYGYFPRAMGVPPVYLEDEVWMLFNGTYLLVLLDRHTADLPAEFIAAAKRSIRAAAAAAANVPPLVANTGQSLLQTFLVLHAGEVLDDGDLLRAGHGIWDTVYRFILQSGFSEANSPNYGKIHLYSLGFVADYLRDATVRKQAAFVRRLLWWSITNHWDQATQQLAGPFIRTFTDRMACQLSGIHFSLYRESGGRIAIPPERANESDYQDATQPLHAVLATLFRPSWPAAWLQRALAGRHEFQFRERTIAYGAPNRGNYGPPNRGVSQLTTFMNGKIALGSRNQQPATMNPQTRDVIAHAAGPGGVGVFRLRIDERHPTVTRLVTVQQKRSLAAAIVVDGYDPRQVRSRNLTLEWTGTAQSPPRLISPTGFGRTAVVSWMGTRMRVEFVVAPGITQHSERLTVMRPDRQTLQIVWSGPVPPQPTAPDGYNTRAVVLAGFSLHLEDRSAHLMKPARALAPLLLKPQRGGGWYRSEWASPDGALSAGFEVGRRWAQSNTEFVRGKSVPPAPIQSMLPRG